jgi:putative ABC transport system permease protein
MFQELRYAIRTLSRSRAVSLLIVLMLGVGIGSTTAIFSAVDALILRPFSFPRQERLVAIHERKLDAGMPRAAVAPGDLVQWKAQSQSFEDLIAFRTEDFDLLGRGQPERFAGYRVSPSFFAALGVTSSLGRAFVPSDGDPGREQVVILKHSLWTSRFSSDPGIIDQAINLNGKPFVVVGVMPATFNFPVDAGEFWTPLVIDAAMAEDRAGHYLRVIGLLRPGVHIQDADAELHRLMQEAAKAYPKTNSGVDAYAVGLNEDQTRGSRPYLSILMTAVVLVLLIACANAANLLLVRASSRQREIAIRLAVGASRFRLIRQLLVESVLLSIAGAALGLGLAKLGLMTLVAVVPQGVAQFIPGWSRLGLNLSTLLFATVTAFLTGIVFGLLPAWQSSKTDVNQGLKEGVRSVSSERSRWRDLLVVAEVALSIVLLISSGLLIRSFMAVLSADFGFVSRNSVSLRIVVPRDRYSTAEQRVIFVQQLLEKVRALPGVEKAGAVDTLPLSTRINHSFFQIVGQPPFPPASQPITQVNIATADYFETVGTRLRAGRYFSEQDGANAPAVAVVNEAFARKYFPGREALGERLSFGPKSAVEIIGRVENVMSADLNETNEPAIYQPYNQLPTSGISLVVRSAQDGAATVGAVRGELARLDPGVPISGVKLLDEIVSERVAPKRTVMIVLTTFAVIALVLATLGLYAVLSYVVAQRAHELGIRLALGAQTKSVFALIVNYGLRLTLAGAVLGIGVSIGFTRLLKEMLYGIQPADPLTFVVVVLLFVLVAVVACALPALRATRTDPIIALRHE